MIAQKEQNFLFLFSSEFRVPTIIVEIKIRFIMTLKVLLSCSYYPVMQLYLGRNLIYIYNNIYITNIRYNEIYEKSKFGLKIEMIEVNLYLTRTASSPEIKKEAEIISKFSALLWRLILTKPAVNVSLRQNSLMSTKLENGGEAQTNFQNFQ